MANSNKPTSTKKSSEFPETDSPQLQSLTKCMSMCMACSKKCTEEGRASNASLCGECADMCALAIKCTVCESEFQQEVLELCANICDRCADENDRMKSAHCKECADACRDCSANCRTEEYSFK